ncbi:hypothetical protein [Roseateles depolymerans]|uniref:Uncharacterized protein n=1 Tax=Roseateles depolymerans TaxID=76731 RepID=A0A0U3NDY4_9BURK|nr:hypothetical protein [Roseateles depolymerans]ALV06672.1 hypothetical protein RD2015_2200 [Roseateles depolymerans]REG19649.1 hypothetical protein DES44_2149 [Roseateles depolymerans]
MNRLREIASSPSLWMALVCALMLCNLLTGCGGGGDDDEDQRQSNLPVDCKAHPEQCK